MPIANREFYSDLAQCCETHAAHQFRKPKGAERRKYYLDGQTENVRLRAGGLTPIERLRGERICADSGRVYAENIQEVRRQRTERDRLRMCGCGLTAIVLV